MIIGLVLSGGGARGFSHIGVLRALEEMEIKVGAISGTSAGAIVGSLYASGVPLDEMMLKIEKQSFLGFNNFNFNSPGFFNSNSLAQFMQQNLRCKYFEELNFPFYAIATDIENGVYEVFSTGELHNKVAASAAVPLMFDPVEIDGKKYLDGGILNNFPVEPLVKTCDIVIGSNVSQWPEKHTKWTKMLIAQRSFQLAISGNMESKKAHCHVVIDPPIGHFQAFSKSKTRELVQIGYQATMDQKELLISLCKNL